MTGSERQPAALRSWMADVELPRPGYWLARVRLGPGHYGPLTPAAIERIETTHEPGCPDNPMERSPFLAAFLAGEPVSLWTLYQTNHTAPERFVRLETEISRSEYEYRLADLKHAKAWRPKDPTGQPKKPVDWLQAELPL